MTKIKLGSFNIKIALMLSGAVIVVLILIYTQLIVGKIQNREREIVRLYAKSIEYIANDQSSSGEYTFIFDEIINQIDFPIIMTDKDKKNAIVTKNIDLDSTLSQDERNKILLKLADEMDESNEPITVKEGDIILNYVHYGQSSLITGLRILPLFEFIIGGVFLLFGYIGFSYIKKNEQSNIWVGLSRETAHQLGTPLTSLIGWIEMLKHIEPKDANVSIILNEIENDIEKLNKIAGRFSKIGSQPILKTENLKNVINTVTAYFEKRIPTLVTHDGKATKKVSIQLNGSDDITAMINRDLFEWVIENLLKNALDAMDKSSGLIKFNISEKNKEVLIDVCDTGKGIDIKHKNDIFRPGFSTKQRGWGLGLSLSKRIIEDYHKGKLILLESELKKGTTFRIKLNKH